MNVDEVLNQVVGKHVGNLKISKGKKALTIHLFNEGRYLSIPLVEIEAMIYEQMHGVNSNRVAPVLEYPLISGIENKQKRGKKDV